MRPIHLLALPLVLAACDGSPASQTKDPPAEDAAAIAADAGAGTDAGPVSDSAVAQDGAVVADAFAPDAEIAPDAEVAPDAELDLAPLPEPADCDETPCGRWDSPYDVEGQPRDRCRDDDGCAAGFVCRHPGVELIARHPDGENGCLQTPADPSHGYCVPSSAYRLPCELPPVCVADQVACLGTRTECLNRRCPQLDCYSAASEAAALDVAAWERDPAALDRMAAALAAAEPGTRVSFRYGINEFTNVVSYTFMAGGAVVQDFELAGGGSSQRGPGAWDSQAAGGCFQGYRAELEAEGFPDGGDLVACLGQAVTWCAPELGDGGE